MKHVNDFVDEIDEKMGSPKFQTKFHSGFKDDDSKKCWIDLSLQMRFKNKTKDIKPMFMITLQMWLKLLQYCYNLEKLMFCSKIWMFHK
jgi:hypothetical protein